MTPFLFGSNERMLYGAWHPSHSPSPAPAVLLCQPWGQEYVRCHRMIRALAVRLARQRTCSLRFDYSGTGDSEGADEDASLNGWVGDVIAAHEETRRRAGTDRVVWLGVRLGAVAALLAAAKVVVRPVGLVLWEPIGTGAEYLADLALRHREALEASYTLAPSGLPPGDRDELLGFGLGERMRCELNELVLQQRLAGARLPPSTWILPTSPPAYVASPLAESGATTRRFDHPIEWNAEESLNSALVPAEAVNLLLEACLSFR